jgi:L-ascorbate metabolism protein UlaG (beta-lactamase superfamily)
MSPRSISNTSMERTIEKQAMIHRQRDDLIARYPALWNQLITEWNSPDSDDRAWLMYAASYLFLTAGVQWAMDPLMFRTRIPEAPFVDAVHDLQNLSFVILTHRHADHLDLDLLRTLKDLPTCFIVPDFMLPLVLEQTGIPKEKIIIPIPLQPVEMNGICITPFNGLHWENDPSKPSGLRGVPAMGYLIEFSGKRWLFPGDTRVYDAAQLPAFGPVDGLFAHLWLGRGCAMIDSPPLLDAFCRFCLALQPRHIILSHLDELNRSPMSYWDDSHANLAAAALQKISPDTRISSVHMGESVQL